jgi:hypothetical protein
MRPGILPLTTTATLQTSPRVTLNLIQQWRRRFLWLRIRRSRCLGFHIKPSFFGNRRDKSTGDVDVPKAEMSVDEAVEHARRAFALKQFEKAVEYYAAALESV